MHVTSQTLDIQVYIYIYSMVKSTATRLRGRVEGKIPGHKMMEEEQMPEACYSIQTVFTKKYVEGSAGTLVPLLNIKC